MNLVTSTLSCLGSGSTSRRATLARLGIPSLRTYRLRAGTRLLRLLGAVLGTALIAVFHPAGVQRAADDVVAHPGQVLDPSAADEHQRVLLQVVPLARDVG